MSARRALTRFRVDDERGAEERAWEVARSAYWDRERLPTPRSYSRQLLALAGAVIVGVLALSPAGATVGRLITKALGVQHAASTLFALPAHGRVLVSGAGGTWTVADDGAARRLGPWTQASWSPHGRYVTVVRANQLMAVDPRGITQWILARPAVSEPRWYSPTGYRVAYLSANELRVVAGDGTGDHLLAVRVADVAPAWRPAHNYQLAYVAAGGRLVVRNADTGRAIWAARLGTGVERLMWSADGSRLLAFSPSSVRIYAANGTLASSIALPRGAFAIDGALSPDGRTLALIRGGSASDVVVEDLAASHPVPRRVFTGAGLRQVDWSPDGRWLLVSWPAPDQWVFVRVSGGPRISAVSRIAEQFSHGGRTGFPTLEGWCCSSQGAAG